MRFNVYIYVSKNHKYRLQIYMEYVDQIISSFEAQISCEAEGKKSVCQTRGAVAYG